MTYTGPYNLPYPSSPQSNPTKVTGTQYDPNSVTDYLKSQGKSSDFASRSALYGQGYTGTGEQNTSLLKKLRGGGASTPPPTTLSNITKIEQIPKMTSTLDNLSNKGLTNDGAGNTRYADGSFYSPPTDDGTTEEQTIDTSEEDKQSNDLLEAMKANLDASTKSLIDNIQQKFAMRRAEQQDINTRQNKGITNALLMGGVTGQGSSAQYAPISSAGTISAQESYGVKQIAELDAQEQDLIASARAAQASGDFDIMEKKLAMVQAKRQEKIEAATKLNERIAEQNAKIRDRNAQISKDSALADLYSQGITDPGEILQSLNENGGNFTLEEVTKGLKSLVPDGLDDLVKTLRNNGAPVEVIQKVLSSKNMGDAYANAGNYSAGGTGMVGEYNFYKAQAESRGQVPVDFNTYQNMDANRKIRIAAAANAAGLTQAGINTALKLSDDYEQRSKDYYSQREAYNRIVSSASDPSPAGDLALIFNYMKVLDPGSTVREGEFANAQNSGSLPENVRAKYNKIINGERLTKVQRDDFVKRASTLFNGAKKQQDSVVNEFKNRAKQYGVPDDLVIRDTSATGSNADEIVKTEDEAKKMVITYGTTHPNDKITIKNLLTQNDPSLGRPLNYLEVYQLFH